MKTHFLAIEGNIGSGKTSLARIISAKYNRRLLLEEFAENTFLPQFYRNPDQFAFPLELSFLAGRYNQIKNIADVLKSSGQPIVSDYLFNKSLVFANITLNDHELELYKRFYDIILPLLPKPDLVVYLKKSVPQLQQNIRKRGRNYENEIRDEYLLKIENSYKQFFDDLKEPSVMVVDTDQVDFINNPAHLENLLGRIFNNL